MMLSEKNLRFHYFFVLFFSYIQKENEMRKGEFLYSQRRIIAQRDYENIWIPRLQNIYQRRLSSMTLSLRIKKIVGKKKKDTSGTCVFFKSPGMSLLIKCHTLIEYIIPYPGIVKKKKILIQPSQGFLNYFLMIVNLKFFFTAWDYTCFWRGKNWPSLRNLTDVFSI